MSVNNVVLHCTMLITLSMHAVRLLILDCVNCVVVICCAGKLCCAYSPIVLCVRVAVDWVFTTGW